MYLRGARSGFEPESSYISGLEPEVSITGLMVTCCGMAVKRMGMLGVGVRKMKALTVKMETVTLIGKRRQNVTCFVC